ncbi:hypothetical protein [Campylobacter sp.]|uniref:hypothetical protein n=1 Tax=Campylobacter sp. TaxID=205 RepID=UPI002A751BE2|nr:hypothetical protein [Campylobacter sp.]MDY2763331.1 hypothetical protein [Campylobacter sp.]
MLRIRWLLRTRWVAIFSFKAAALAVGGGVSSCKNFALNFQGVSRRKRVQKFLQSGWAAQGFKAESTTKRLRSNQRMRSKKKLSQPIKN